MTNETNINITIGDAVALIEGTRSKGTAFGVTFIKRTTGEVREMNARLGVSKGVTGVGMAYDPTKKNLIGCADMQKIIENRKAGMEEIEAVKKAYRMISADAITHLSVGGSKYTIIEGA